MKRRRIDDVQAELARLREPYVIVVDGKDYTAFGDEHTIEDIVRFAIEASNEEQVLAAWFLVLQRRVKR